MVCYREPGRHQVKQMKQMVKTTPRRRFWS